MIQCVESHVWNELDAMDHIVQSTSDVYYAIQLLRQIGKMYFSLWKPPGVSERWWSVKFKASISGEY
jgi:hypothetical protein